MKRARSGLKSVGALQLLDRRLEHRPVHFVRSQFSIYDFEDLASLDSPWWSYGAIDAVTDWINGRSTTRAFEWGAGSSTMWLQSRVDEVISVEHDLSFAESVRPFVADTTSLMVVAPTESANPAVGSGHRDWGGWDFTDYVNAIDSTDGLFDLICIDGRARSHCLERAVDKLASGGIIVFDNSDRDRYQYALADSAFATELHHGWAPALPIKTSTSILRLVESSTR